MRTLKILIRIEAGILVIVGWLRAFAYNYSLGEVTREAWYAYAWYDLPFKYLGVSLLVLAIILFLVNDLLLIGARRQLGLSLAVGNLVLTMTAFVHGTGQSVNDWILLLVPLAMALALGWASLRPLNSDEAAAELASLKVPEEIREALLRRFREAAAQEERNRLARDLHDSIKQQLFSINVGTATAQERWERDPEGARTALQHVRLSAKAALVEMQAMLHQLRPEALASTGLIEALREQCEALGYRSGAEVTLELGDLLPDNRMPPGAQDALFRIAQEALANVARHARARAVRVWLGRDGDTAVLRVEDDGQGFDPRSGTSGMGLRNLRERAESLHGALDIGSAPGAGTAISVRLPLTPPPPSQEPEIEKEIQVERRDLWGVPASVIIFLQLRIAQVERFEDSLGVSLFVLLLLILLSAWSLSRTRKVLRTASAPDPSAASRLWAAGSRTRALNLLVASWWGPWYWGWGEGGWITERIVWAGVALLCLGLAATEAARFHRFSTPRRRWLPQRWGSIDWWQSTFGGAIPLLFLLALILINQRDEPLLPLKPEEIAVLVSSAVASLYFLVRQPREERA
jgi:signal transduction histidine kinase